MKCVDIFKFLYFAMIKPLDFSLKVYLYHWQGSYANMQIAFNLAKK